MNAPDRKLLLRVAQRMERQAKEAYEAAGKSEQAKYTRDNIMGDVLDLRDYVERVEEADATSAKVVGEHGVKLLQGGAVIVPVEPTAGMKDPGGDLLGDPNYAASRSNTDLALDVWAVMIKAVRPGEPIQIVSADRTD